MSNKPGVVESFVRKSTTLLIYPLVFPFILIFYAITSSIMNKDLGAVVYIFGLVITMINNYLINSGTVVENKSSGLKSEFCYIGIPFIPKFNMRSSPNMAVITYTFFFFLMPSFIRNLHYMKNPLALMEYMFDKNKLLILFFGLTMVFNRYSEKYFGCSNPNMNGLDISNGFIVGMFSAWLMLLLFYVTGHKNLLLTSRFLDNKVLCVVPNNKVFKCSNNNNISAIAFSTHDTPNKRYDERLFYGDRDLARLDGMKLAGIWTNVHIYGNTDLVVYKYPDFKGDKILIKYRDMKQKLKRDENMQQGRSKNTGNDATESQIVYKWENNYINAIKSFNKQIYDATKKHHPLKTITTESINIVLETPYVGRVIPLISNDWKYNDNGTNVDISFNLITPSGATVEQDDQEPDQGGALPLVNYDGTAEKPITITTDRNGVSKTYDNISNNFKDDYTIVKRGSETTEAKIKYTHTQPLENKPNDSVFLTNGEVDYIDGTGSIYPIGKDFGSVQDPIPQKYFIDNYKDAVNDDGDEIHLEEIKLITDGHDFGFEPGSSTTFDTGGNINLNLTWKEDTSSEHNSIIIIRQKKNDFIKKNKKILVYYIDYAKTMYDTEDKQDTGIFNTMNSDEKVKAINKLEDAILELLGNNILDDIGTTSSGEKYITLTKADLINKCLWNKKRCSESPLLSQQDSSTETLGSIQLIKSKD